MNTKPKRIDFNLFKPAEKLVAAGGLLIGSCKALLSEDTALQSVISKVKPDALIMWVSEGNWSMHEMLLQLLNITGPADVTISSYAMSELAARTLSQLKHDKMIISLRCLLDNRVDVRSAGSLQLIKATCDQMALVDTHAKVTVIRNASWNITVVGSANYTENKRWESGLIDMNPVVADFQLLWMNKALNHATA